MLEHPEFKAMYQALVDKANEGMDPWSTIKKFKLLPDVLSPENGMLTPTLKVKRRNIHDQFADEIEALYGRGEPITAA